MSTALSGLQILDFSNSLAGALTTMVLCDNGATVLKVEPPEGDSLRVLPAAAQWFRGKQSIVLDLKSAAGRDRARELAGDADVLIESWRPGVADRLGLGSDALLPDLPGLIYCSITGFGPNGPYRDLRGYEAVVAAKTGGLAGPDRPRYSAMAGASFGASQGALQGILAALYVRHTTGRGQRVQTSLVQGLTSYDLYGWLGPQLQADQAAVANSAASVYSPVAGFTGFTKDDRWLQFANYRPHLLSAFLKAIDLEDWHTAAMARGEAHSVIMETVLRRLHEKTLDEWMPLFLASDDIGVEIFRTPREAMDHPQVLHNHDVIEVSDAAAGTMRQIGPLVTLTETPAAPQSHAPALDENSRSDRDLNWLSRATGDVEAAAAAGTQPAGAQTVHSQTAGMGGGGPLAGVTIVELAWFYAAPFGTALLADLGARVIKVEGPEGDPHRRQNPLSEYAGVKGLQGKESIALDYRTPEGLEVLRTIVAGADAVMSNYRGANGAGSAIGYRKLAEANPELVYLYAGAYGSSGPYSARPAFAPSMGVASGQRVHQLGWEPAAAGGSITFDEGMQRLADMALMTGGPTYNADATAAVVVGTAMLLGLVARQRHGLGQYSESTMLCSNTYLVSEQFFDDAEQGHPAPAHDEDGLSALYGLYEVEEGWVFLAAPRASDWAKLCDAFGAFEATTSAGQSLATDTRFATASDRDRNDAELRAELSEFLRPRRADQWEKNLAAYDVTCVEVSSISLSDFTMSSDTVHENNFTAQVTHPRFGPHLRHGPIVDLSDTPGVVGPGSLIGEHTREILRSAGYSDQAIVELRASGLVEWPA